jgi:L-fucose isomerase-like protein
MTSRQVGIVAIARPTFDVPYAEQVAAAAWGVIAGLPGVDVVGSAELALDVDSLETALTPIRDTELDAVVIIQATFADSTLAAAVAAANPAPIVLWAVPEARTGGRLRLNSLCGINLAAYALRRSGKDYRYLLGEPETPGVDTLLLDAISDTPPLPPGTTDRGSFTINDDARAAAHRVAVRLGESTVGLIGERPDGFEPCDYDPVALANTTGTRVDAIGLPRLFAAASAADPVARTKLREEVESSLAGVDALDSESVDRSLELGLGMRRLVEDRGWTGFATRCWPECFTEFGGAACTPMSLCNSAGVPGCCEADVYGSVTSIILQELTGAPAFVADLVDLDFADNTGVLWHCGLAPIEMAATEPAPRATIHSNRAMPLLNEFTLRAGPVTLARLSQSGNEQRLLIGGGVILARPPAFSGTSGVIRFDAAATDVFRTIMREGLEHHYGVAYGDLRSRLHALADELDLPTVALTERIWAS